MGFRHLIAAALLSLPLISGALAQEQAGDEPSHRDILRAAINQFILPGYERLEQEAELQAHMIGELCEAPDDAALRQARHQFEALVRAWSRIEVVRFGPILAENRLERILFWPDRRGIGLRQVQGIIGNKDETAIDPDTLRQKSVAVQGLLALEFVLHGTGSEDLATAEGAFRCRYGEAIATTIRRTAGVTLSDWDAVDGIRSRLLDPDDAYPDYRTEKEAMREIIGVFVHGAELLRDTRLIPFIGVDGEEGNPRQALYYRSGLTLEALRSSVAGLRMLFIVSGLSDLLEDENRYVGGAFVFEMNNFLETIGSIETDAVSALDDPDALARLKYLIILTGSIQNVAVNQIAAELGLSVGFSALDGD